MLCSNRQFKNYSGQTSTIRPAKRTTTPRFQLSHLGAVQQIHAIQRSVGNQGTIRYLAQRAPKQSHDQPAPESIPSAPATQPLELTEEEKKRQSIQRKEIPGLEAGLVGAPAQHGARDSYFAAGAYASNSSPVSLAVAPPEGQPEDEADRIADQVVDAIGSDRLTLGAPGESGTPAHSSRPLDGDVRARFESHFGWDFSAVRIHTDAAAAKSAEDLNAFAYTVGSNIVFGAGQYAPDMPAGRRLLAHELTHVVQQGGASPLEKPSGPEGRSQTAPAFQATVGGGAARSIARDSKTPIPFPRVQYSGPDGAFYRRFDGVTTYSMTPKDRLAKAGYRFARNEGGHDVWVKVDRSSEIWVQIPKPNTDDASGGASGGSGSGAGPAPPTNPNIQDARAWAQDLETRFNQLWDEAAKLKAMRDPNGSYPAGPFNDYFKKLNRFDEDLKSVLDQEAPLWRDSPMTDEEKKELEKQIERIKNVQEHPPEMELED